LFKKGTSHACKQAWLEDRARGRLVQIPCIERNVHGAVRAFDSARYSILSEGSHFISFDVVTKVMKETGKDISSLYRETALGGLAIFGDEHFVDN